MQEIADSLALAAIACEGLHGAAEVRLSLDYTIDDDQRTVTVDGSSAVGQSLVRSFMGFLTRELGESGFSVKRLVP